MKCRRPNKTNEQSNKLKIFHKWHNVNRREIKGNPRPLQTASTWDWTFPTVLYIRTLFVGHFTRGNSGQRFISVNILGQGSSHPTWLTEWRVFYIMTLLLFDNEGYNSTTKTIIHYPSIERGTLGWDLTREKGEREIDRKRLRTVIGTLIRTFD